MKYIAHINNDDMIQSVEEHCLNTAVLSSEMVSSLGLKNTAYIAGFLHDAGKCTEEFNQYINSAYNGEKVRRGSVIHSFAGLSYILKKYHKNTYSYESIAAEIIAYAIGSHHGTFDIYNENHECGFDHRINKQPDYDKKALKNYFDEIDDIPKFDFTKEIKVACNKICESYESQDEVDFCCGLLTRLISSALIDADRTDTAAFMSDEDNYFKYDSNKIWIKSIRNLNDYISKINDESEISKARKHFSDLCEMKSNISSGIFKLNLPTGSGKTLSSLRFALNHALNNNMERIIFVSPLLTILEQNAKVIRDAVKNDEIILEHHSNVLTENDDKSSKYDILTENWNSPIVITTLVQLLDTMFKSKSSNIRRFHALSNAVIVIDEIQTVPTNMISIFNLTVNFLTQICHSSVVLCSATQPVLCEVKHKMFSDITDIVPWNEVSKYYDVFKRNTLINKGRCKLNEIPDLIYELKGKYKSVLVVCNKKSEAEELYNKIFDSDICNVYHLSASMCIEHRRNVLEEIKNKLKNNESIICISTQVIESGVDISFDSVIRFTAGLDSIVQSAGRCNRNGKNSSDSPVYIIHCIDESLDNLKEIQSAQNATVNLLEQFKRKPEKYANDLSSEESVKEYYKLLYASMEEDHQDYPVKNGQTVFSMLSGNKVFVRDCDDKYFLKQAFKTAGDSFEVFDSKQTTVVVPYKNGKEFIREFYTERAQNDLNYLNQLLRKAKPFCISVFDYQIKILEKENGIYSACGGKVFTLSKDFYSEKIGLTFNKSEKEKDECDSLML